MRRSDSDIERPPISALQTLNPKRNKPIERPHMSALTGAPSH